jgi:hypothetical protein
VRGEGKPGAVGVGASEREKELASERGGANASER